MLYLSLNPNLLIYVASRQIQEDEIVEDYGKLSVPFAVDRSFFYQKDALAMVTALFQSLPHYPSMSWEELALSLPPTLLTYTLSPEPIPQWIDRIRFGETYIEALSKKNYTLEKGYLTIWYDPKILDLFVQAAKNCGFVLQKITSGFINAINAINMIYDTKNYDKFSLLKWDSFYSELALFKKNILTGYLCFRINQSKLLPLNINGDIPENLSEILDTDNLTENLYKTLGPIFLYSHQVVDSDPLEPFKKFGFCEIINPWTGLRIDTKQRENFSELSSAERSLWTETAGFITRESL